MSNPKRKQVFAAHVAAGWQVVCEEAGSTAAVPIETNKRKKQKVVSRVYVLQPPTTVLPRASTTASSDLAARLSAYGLDTPADACRRWGVSSGCHPSLCKDQGQRRVAQVLWQLAGAVSAARLSAAVLMSAGWCAAALQAVATGARELRRLAQQGPWMRSGPPAAQRAADTLLSTLDSGLAEALQWSARCERGGMHAEAAVMVVAGCDAMYYGLLDHHLTAGWATPAVPPPHEYFPAMADAHPGNAAACQALLLEAAGAHTTAALAAAWELQTAAEEGDQGEEEEENDEGARGRQLVLPAGTADSNPLLATMWARWQEGCRLLWSLGLGVSGEMDGVVVKAPRPHKGGKPPDPAPPPAYPALLAWRESGRECHTYAFAAPNGAALDALVARAPLLEVGAGTGYWASLLRQRGADVAAYDIAPPSAAPSAAPNDYHGRTPALTEVRRGGPEVLEAPGAAGRALLLCYPPPGGSMASDCLRRYRGSCVCVVGEWDGDTGSAAFTSGLLRDFRLVQRVALPNWTDTAHELTIWERKGSPSSGTSKGSKSGSNNGSDKGNGESNGEAQRGTQEPERGRQQQQQQQQQQQPLQLLSCARCGKAHSYGGGGGQKQKHKGGGGSGSGGGHQAASACLRRCRFCRETAAAYCSAACEREDGPRHMGAHALRLMFFQTRTLSFASDADYAPVKV